MGNIKTNSCQQNKVFIFVPFMWFGGLLTFAIWCCCSCLHLNMGSSIWYQHSCRGKPCLLFWWHNLAQFPLHAFSSGTESGSLRTPSCQTEGIPWGFWKWKKSRSNRNVYGHSRQMVGLWRRKGFASGSQVFSWKITQFHTAYEWEYWWELSVIFDSLISPWLLS